MKRLFIAIPIQSESKDKIKGLLSDTRLNHLPVKWTAYQNLHLTIQFLGDVDEKRIGDLKQMMVRIKEPVRNEFVKFTEIGSFPGGTNPKIIYLGIDKPEFLQKIHQQISRDLAKNGFIPDRKPFKPHLTLARVKEYGVVSTEDLFYLTEKFKHDPIAASPLDRIILFESTLKPSGPVYSSLYEKSLFAKTRTQSN